MDVIIVLSKIPNLDKPEPKKISDSLAKITRKSEIRIYAFSKISLGKRGPCRAVDIKSNFVYSDICLFIT